MSLPAALADLAGAGLRRLEPERAHELGLRALEAGLGPSAPAGASDGLAVRLAGLDLPNPIGLAAGFDKDARVPAALLRAGFGWVECGTVTPLPQAGNPAPRLFRLTEERAVINRLGFNNGGLEAFCGRMARRDRAAGIVGANLGANKDSVDRMADYVAGLVRVWPLADHVTVNVSSPNTPGLRALQGAGALDELGGRLAEARAALRLGAGGAAGPPLFLKIAPDLDAGEIVMIVERARAHGFDGLVVSNTTVSRPDGLRGAAAGEAGGLSGAPLFARSTAVLREAAGAARGTGLVLVAAGGVASGADVLAKLRAGASAVQLYTALAYAGPGVVPRMLRDLRQRLQAEGFGSVAEAAGAG